MPLADKFNEIKPFLKRQKNKALHMKGRLTLGFFMTGLVVFAGIGAHKSNDGIDYRKRTGDDYMRGRNSIKLNPAIRLSKSPTLQKVIIDSLGADGFADFQGSLDEHYANAVKNRKSILKGRPEISYELVISQIDKHPLNIDGREKSIELSSQDYQTIKGIRPQY